MAQKYKFVHGNITEKIISAIHSVFNKLQFGYPKKAYQRAPEIELDKLRLKYMRECYGKNIV